MAQWAGQFSGFTHETKVQDFEVSLRHAVESFQASSETDRDARLKAVHRLAQRLQAARLKSLRARLSALTKRGRKGFSDDGQASHLRIRIAELDAQDIEVVLREFGLYDDTVA